MILSPREYSGSSIPDLLSAAARGHVGLDHRFLRAILDRGPSAVPELLKFGLADQSRQLVDLEEELISIFRHLRAPEALPYFVELVRRQPEDIPDDVVHALIEIGDAAAVPLLKLYEELDSEDNDVPFLLASLRVRNPRILEILIDRLAYDPVDAGFCLELYGDEAARPALEKALAELGAEDPEIRRSLEEALERLGKMEPDPVIEAFDIWDLYPDEDTPHLDLLSEQEKIEFLKSPEADYRALAAQSLSKVTLSDRARAELKRVAETDPDPNVRADCWETLGPNSVDDPGVRSKMIERLSDPTTPAIERCGALIGLSADSNNPPLAKWVLEFYKSPDTRAKAIESMWRSFDSQYVEYFQKHLDDPSVDIKREAVWGIGHLRVQTEASRLRALFQDEELRTDALYNYAVAWPGDISRARAKSLLRRIDEWAGGLSEVEAQLVRTGIDERLQFEGFRPVFDSSESEQEEPVPAKAGRNDACPCGSGKKYKKCCGQ